MKLYDLPYGTDFQLRDEDGNALRLRFHYIDGAYSYCTDKDGNSHHIAVWSDVEIVDEEPERTV